MLISGAMLLGPPTGLHAVCTRVLACVPCVLAREDVWWSGSRLECQAHLSEGDGVSGFHVAVAVAPGAVLLGNPGGQSGRGVVEAVGQSVRVGALHMGVATLRLLPPRSLVDERLIGRGEGPGMRSQIGGRARDRGEMNAIQVVGMGVSQPRCHPAANVAALRGKARGP